MRTTASAGSAKSSRPKAATACSTADRAPAPHPLEALKTLAAEALGLTTEQIARAFLQSPATIAQRIVRAKAKIRDAGIPYQVPVLNELPERLESVLRVIYLVFNEGYSASSGNVLLQQDLSDEAIRLGRLLVQLLPEWSLPGGWLQAVYPHRRGVMPAVRAWIDHLVESFNACGERLL